MMEFFEDSNLEPPADYEFEDENYPPIEEEIDYDYNEFYNSQMMAPFTLEEILHHCIEPTLSDGFRHVGKIIIWCIIFRISDAGMVFCFGLLSVCWSSSACCRLALADLDVVFGRRRLAVAKQRLSPLGYRSAECIPS